MQNSQWITLPTQLCQILYSFCANLLHSLIMWLIVSSLSPHNLHLLFCCVLSILISVWLIFYWIFCADIRRDLGFPLLAVHVFSFEILVIGRLKRPWSCFSFHFSFLVVVVLLVLVLSVVSSSMLLYVAYKSLYWDVNIVING